MHDPLSDSLSSARHLIDSIRQQFDQEKERIARMRTEEIKKDDFGVSNLFFFKGPNYYLNHTSLIFNLLVLPAGPGVDFIKEEVEKYFPALKEQEIPYVAELFAATVIELQKCFDKISLQHYKVHRIKNDYVIAVEYYDPEIAENAVQLAAKWFNSIINHKPFNFTKEYANFLDNADQSIYLTPIISRITGMAKKLNIPCKYIDNETVFQFGLGKNSLRFDNIYFNTDNIIDINLLSDKSILYQILQSHNFPIAPASKAIDKKSLFEKAEEYGFPLICRKPMSHINNESHIIDSASLLEKHFEQFQQESKRQFLPFMGMLIQKTIPGFIYKALLVDGRFTTLLKIESPKLTGNAKSSIQDLIATENQNPLRTKKKEYFLQPIDIDETLEKNLYNQGLNLNYVPVKDEIISLTHIFDIEKGAIPVAIGEGINNKVIELLEMIGSQFEVKLLEITFTSSDISKPWMESKFYISDVGHGTNISSFLITNDEAEKISKKILINHFGNAAKSRIPVILANKTSESLLEALKKAVRKIKPNVKIGILTKNSIIINDQTIDKTPNHNLNTELLAKNSTVDLLILTHDKDSIYDFGLPFSGADIIILDEPSHAESLVLNNQAFEETPVVEIENGEISVKQNGKKKEAGFYRTETDKTEKIIAAIGLNKIEDLILKYDI